MQIKLTEIPRKKSKDKMLISFLLMVIAVELTDFFFIEKSPFRYIGLIGFFMIGFFWNRRVIE